MPTSFVGLLLFVVLLAPGLTFRWRRTAHQPVQKPSELRELATAVLVSGICDAVVLAIFGVWRTLKPSLALDVGRLIRDGGKYFEVAYVATLLWLCGLLVLACAAALALAWLIDQATTEGTWTNRVTKHIRAHRPDDVTTEPAWWCMFANRPEDYVYAGCQLDDGSYIGGFVYKFSAESDETADRELVLTDAEYRGDDGRLHDLESSAVVLSARHLQYLTVTYISKN